jgi:hypothetical protein
VKERDHCDDKDSQRKAADGGSTNNMDSSKLIFILGTGRSGTHWLGYILQAHPDIRVTVEEKPMFLWSTEMALRPATRATLFPQLAHVYRQQHALSAPRHYVDKSHPNIWIAEQLADEFPGALFLGILRNPYATTASMLRHEGILDWQKRWKEFPVPNLFLGITEENAGGYDSMSVARQCGLRWRAHREQMERVKNALGSRIKVFRYEDVIKQTSEHLRELEQFLQLRSPIPFPTVKEESRYKWKAQLSAEQKTEIAEVVGFGPEQAE